MSLERGLMSEAQQPTEQEVIQAVFIYAAQEMRNGRSDYQIEKSLIERGLEKDSARAVVDKLASLRSEAQRNAAKRSMLIGGAIAIIGLIITLGTYAAASDGGGRYIVTWGAIIFGGIQFLRGFSKYSGG